MAGTRQELLCDFVAFFEIVPAAENFVRRPSATVDTVLIRGYIDVEEGRKEDNSKDAESLFQHYEL